MNEPITTLDTRHGVPRGGVTPWEETRRVLETAELFWLSTVRADGRPHVTPCVPVWHDGAIHFTATVPGHSCWPQNGPFDANLAHLLSCNTASLCKNTTHKTPQSAGRFVIWLSANKRHFLFRHLVMIGVTTATFCVDFWRFLLRSRTIPAKQRVHRLSSSSQDGFAGQERDHLPDQISHTPWASRETLRSLAPFCTRCCPWPVACHSLGW
jgi:hypothetical protein